MLLSLNVRNYALIESLAIEFDSGLNIITGQTGAGKSILLGALGLLLGEKSESGVQKNPDENCTIEGVFDLAGLSLEQFFEHNDLDYAPQTTIRRVISSSGKSRAFVNDIPVQLSALKELGSNLIDIHSQHQNLLLKDDSFRINVVDSVAAHGKLLAEYADHFAALCTKRRELAALHSAAEQNRREEEYLRYQVEQFTTLKLKRGEQQTLEDEYKVLTNADSIRQTMGESIDALSEEQTGVLARLKIASTEFAHIADKYPDAQQISERINTSLVDLKDLTAELEERIGHVESDAERLDKVTARLNAIYELEQKHHAEDGDALLAVWADFEQKLASITGEIENTTRLERDIEELQKTCKSLADKISEGRRRAAPVISKSVGKMLTALGIPDALFEVRISPSGELRTSGGDEIEFLFSANKGVAPRGIERIASGGEISRVMLALKALTARRAGLPTIIFDEIDTGVSGRVADAMGDIVADLASGMQVVNITHLPQIASKGKTHLLVYKTEGATHIRRIEGDERVAEIAAMISGSTVTEAAKAQARELLGK